MTQILKKPGFSILCFFMVQTALYAQNGDYWEKAEEKGRDAASKIEEIRGPANP